MFHPACSQTCTPESAEATMAAARPTETAQAVEKDAGPAAPPAAGDAREPRAPKRNDEAGGGWGFAIGVPDERYETGGNEPFSRA